MGEKLSFEQETTRSVGKEQTRKTDAVERRGQLCCCVLWECLQEFIEADWTKASKSVRCGNLCDANTAGLLKTASTVKEA